MQIKTTMRYHLTPVRRTITQKTKDSKCWEGCGEKEILVHCWWEYELIQTLWEKVQILLKKLKIELPYNPAIPLLGLYTKEIKILKRGFPGGAVVENLPANAGDTGSSPGLGRSHVPRSNQAREPQLLSLSVWSLCSATREAAIVRGQCTAMKSGPRLPQMEKALTQKRRPNTAINK